MNIELAEDFAKQVQCKVDDTEALKPGMPFTIGGLNYVIVFILNDNDLSLMYNETGILH